ncbi:MerR family transcriptional regulator [Vagococcus fluvialis]|uniref:MerR family transcriptional regulator n=1 Tax=Lactobacillales TaxID=186826 RepID=UPI00359F393B
MKKLSEVCKIVGVTRRTLQEYNKIGLLQPTSKTESGYWLYNDTAIKKLSLIQIFIEGGYERKVIKSILESPTLDLLVEFDHLIETLEEKRKRIDGMINTLRTYKIIPELPEGTLRALSNLDVNRIYKDKSFSSYWEDSIVHYSEYTEIDDIESKLFISFLYNLIAVGSFLGTPEDTKKVQVMVNELFKSMMEIIIFIADKDDDFEESLIGEELAEGFLEFIQDILSDSEWHQDIIDTQYGDGATEYIIRAVRLFSDKKMSESKTIQKGE